METTQVTHDGSYIIHSMLLELLQMNVDSRNGFAYAGKRLAESRSSIATRFHRTSQERNDFCMRLREGVMAIQDAVVTQGTIVNSLHRIWTELREELIESVDIPSVVRKSLQGERLTKQAYEFAIGSIEEPHVLLMLKDQYQSICESHKWLTGLKEDDDNRARRNW
jgi:uncharacterized protein (TIGR02284 family)